jgi:hypothetical protein
VKRTLVSRGLARLRCYRVLVDRGSKSCFDWPRRDERRRKVGGQPPRRKKSRGQLGERPRPKLGGQPALSPLEPAARSLHSLWLWCAYGEIKVLSSLLRSEIAAGGR